MVDTLAMWHVFLGIFRLSPASIIPPMLYIRSRIHSFFYGRRSITPGIEGVFKKQTVHIRGVAEK